MLSRKLLLVLLRENMDHAEWKAALLRTEAVHARDFAQLITTYMAISLNARSHGVVSESRSIVILARGMLGLDPYCLSG